MTPKGYDYLVGSVSGSLAGVLVSYPMHLLKIRYAVNDGNKFRPQYSSYLDVSRKIFRAQGFRGFYQGLSPNLVAAPIGCAIWFQGYDAIRPCFNVLNVSPILQSFAAGSVMSAFISTIVNPLRVANTRLCLQYETSGPKKYRGLVHCLAKIYSEEGVKGWYKGYVPTLWCTLGGSFSIAIYTTFKEWRLYNRRNYRTARLSKTESVLLGMASMSLAMVAFYPFYVIRFRLQDHNTNYKSVTDVLIQTLQKEGIYGFYKGMLMAHLKPLPFAAVFFIVYEHTKKLAAQQKNSPLLQALKTMIR